MNSEMLIGARAIYSTRCLNSEVQCSEKNGPSIVPIDASCASYGFLDVTTASTQEMSMLQPSKYNLRWISGFQVC